MAYLRIVRPFNCLFVALTVLFGAYYRNPLYLRIEILAAVISAVLIAAAGYVVNDCYDIEIDRINKPDRILPSGKISLPAAYRFSWIMFALGLGTSYFIRINYCSLIAVFNIILLYLYAQKFKKSLLTGNLIVAYAAASTFIYGGLANYNLSNSLIIAIFAFLYTLVREFVKDIEDLEGDRKSGARTLPIRLGVRPTLFISLIPLVLMQVLAILLYLKEIITSASLIMFFILVTVPLLAFFFYIFPGSSKKKLAQVSAAMKIDMLVLLILVWLV